MATMETVLIFTSQWTQLRIPNTVSMTPLKVISPATLEVYNMANDDNKQKVNMILAKFEGYFILCLNITLLFKEDDHLPNP